MCEQKIRTIILEEHNEAFYVIANALSEEKYMLLHIDEHHDLCDALISIENEKDYKEIAQMDLRVSDYIVPLVYYTNLNYIIWLSECDGLTTGIRQFVVEKKNAGDNKFFLKKKYVTNRQNNVCSIVSVRNIDMVKTCNLVISLDLDYFYSDDYLGEQYVIEISEEEYNRIQSNRFHPVKLMHGGRISVYELQKKFYMKYQDFDGLYVKNVIDKAEIEKRIEKVAKILLDNKSTIKLLVICKSEMSMYGNSKVNTYILNRLYALLEGQIDLLL